MPETDFSRLQWTGTPTFGMHIYGRPKEIRFAHLGWLLSAAELPQSLALAEAGELPAGWNDDSGRPGVKYTGDWDARPHPDRVIWVEPEMLATWRLVSGTEDQPIEHTKLLNLVTVANRTQSSRWEASSSNWATCPRFRPVTMSLERRRAG